MDWFKKHADSIATIISVVGAVLWLNGKMESRFDNIEKDITVIKTVLIMKGIMPPELAVKKVETKVESG